MPQTTVQTRAKQIQWTSIATLLAMLATLATLIHYATNIQSQLDEAKAVSIQNCQLLKGAIVLSVEQSLNGSKKAPSSDQRASARAIEKNFEVINCANPTNK